ncbi:MAG: ABC transporter permease [Succinivibrio sp.]|nr:ABC transporter permease [Succinivibrio sp.]
MIDNFFKLLGIPSRQLVTCANQTLYMVFVSLVLGSLIGIIFAFTLVLTAKGGLKENKFVFNTLSFVINTVRSIPFIILLVFILPVTKAIVGTRIGTTAALVPLTFFIAPYIARLFENSLLEVNKGIIEAAKSMGASTFEIILHFWIPEAKSSLILATTIATISLLGATAMAGVIGAGGVGDLALTYGYERMNSALMTFTVIVLIIFVQIIQALGNYLARRARGRR